MALDLITPGGLVPWTGQDIEGVRHPLNIEQLWTDGDLAAIGLQRKPSPMLGPEDVNVEHDRRALAGKVFAVSGYGDVALEGSMAAQTVLLALKDTARDMVGAGISAPVLMFTDRDNADHYLTPLQVIELVDVGKVYMQALHAAKRALKAMDPIPVDYADNQWWPV